MAYGHESINENVVKCVCVCYFFLNALYGIVFHEMMDSSIISILKKILISRNFHYCFLVKVIFEEFLSFKRQKKGEKREY